MNKNYICAMCGNVLNEDNIEVLVAGAGQLKICKDCHSCYDDETPIECNFNQCANCGEFVLFTDNECKYCGYKYSRDFVERIEWITDNLDRDGMLFYDIDTHEYHTGECCLDTCSFEEDIDYILGYLKENYQKKKSLYKVSWLGNPVGLAVGYDNLIGLTKYIKDNIRSMEESRYNDLKFDIEKEKTQLFNMKFYGEDSYKVSKQEGLIVHLEENLNNFWKQVEENFKDKTLLNVERIR